MIKVVKTKELAHCPICGSKVELRRNSGKRFQIKCTNPDCYVRTSWNSKTDTLCNWSSITARLAADASNKQAQQALDNEMQSASSVYRDRKQIVITDE